MKSIFAQKEDFKSVVAVVGWLSCYLHQIWLTFTRTAIVQTLISCISYFYDSSLLIMICSDVSLFLFSVRKTQTELGKTAVMCADAAVWNDFKLCTISFSFLLDIMFFFLWFLFCSPATMAAQSTSFTFTIN